MRTENLFVFDPPLAKNHLAMIRDRETSKRGFKDGCNLLAGILIDRAVEDMPLRKIPVITPMEETVGEVFDGVITAIAIYRASLTMLPAAEMRFPEADTGFIDIARNEVTALPEVSRCKIPKAITGSTVLILDPMLATGGTMSEAVGIVKKYNPSRIKVLAIISAPEGIEKVQHDHPEVPIYTVAVDRGLNAAKYILPGLGDAGDRSYGVSGEIPTEP